MTAASLNLCEPATVTLTPGDLAVWDGRYELLCNIAGHYGAGMYAELDAVTNR